MCFFVTSKHSDKKIAKKDIPCYKHLYIKDNVIRSPFYRYFNKWKLDKKETTELGTKIIEKDSTIIKKGFHSFKISYKRSFIIFANAKFLAYIPEGSEYYENDKEYVSNSIILKEKLEYNSFSEFF